VRSAAPDVAVGVAVRGTVVECACVASCAKQISVGSASVPVVVSYESSFGSAQGMVDWLTLLAEYGS
jgi:hypothetical protein